MGAILERYRCRILSPGIYEYVPVSLREWRRDTVGSVWLQGNFGGFDDVIFDEGYDEIFRLHQSFGRTR